jgi:8-oxo-dGTP pyrophosphatase MutT (NUDIX family)
MFNLDTTDTPSDLIPAATVILLRQYEGRLETLMLRRNRSLKAFGGAWVFPGGRVDDADLPGGAEFERAKHAAVREAHEETGLVLVPDALITLSQWIPPKAEIRRFSTWFFVAEAPEGEVKIDEGEIHDYQWVCPKQVIADTPNPDMSIMPPTYISLYELSQFDQVERAIEAINRRENEHFETRFHKTEHGFTTIWAPDAAYETGELECDGPRRRLECTKSDWRYVREGLPLDNL